MPAPRYLLLVALLLLPAMTLPAEVPIETKTITYQIGGDTFEGCVSRPVKVDGKVPGVLVAHDWTGY